MVSKFEKFIEQEGLCSRHDTILVACSGGLDSMAMLHLFRQSGYQVLVAHVNFQLRGAESDRDEEFVRNYCVAHQLRFVSKRFETNNYAMDKGLSIQMAARELRYQWFNEQLLEYNLRLVATAHHLNDLAETILLNLARGKGVDGLSGIRPKNNNVIRPLLNWTRSELEQFVTAEGIIWREDASNATDDYHRNKVRHQVMPILKELNPSLEETLFEVSKRASLELALLDRAYQEWHKTFVRQAGNMSTIAKAGVVSTENLPLLFRLLRPLGFHYDQCVDIQQAQAGQSGKRFLSSSHELVVDRDVLILAPRAEAFEIRQVGITDYRVEQQGQQLVLEHDYQGNIEPDLNQAFLDANTVVFPLTWRACREGDSFQPLGMEGTRKISDFLIDRKVPLPMKERATVLESGGKIIWVVGYRIDHQVRVRPETKSILRILFK